MKRFEARLLILIFALLCASISPDEASALSQRTPPRSSHAASGSIQLFVQPGAHLAPVLSLIRQARSSIRLEIYLLTDRTVIKELGRARQKGLDVRVLLEEHPYGGSSSSRRAYGELQDAGVSVRWANESAFTFTHEKAIDIDGRVAGIFTFNLTSSGIFRNREFGTIDQNAADARAVATIFDADWNRSRPRISDPRLVVSPYNSRRDFDALIDSAHRTLDLYAEEVNDSSIEAHLASAAHRGVRVRLITSARSTGTDTLARSGVAVHLLRAPYIHAKAIVADRAGLFVGSENISTTSLDRNRELGLVLDDQNLAAVVERTFESDWSKHSVGSGAPSAPRSSRSGTGSLQVRVTTSPSSVHRGQSMTIDVHTSPGATCSVQVTYPDGYVSRSRSLARTRTASKTGAASWSWRVGSKVSGQSQASATCRLGGHSATGSATFEITGG